MVEYTLDTLGWNEWFAAQAGRCGAHHDKARVAAVDRDQLLLVGTSGFFRGKLPGKTLHESTDASQRPCVGDWVCVEKSTQDQFGVVHAILDRQTCLRRKAPGDPVQYQMIAANVDYVVVVQSCHFDFNLKRLERYLVMVKDGGATPLILLTKVDLMTADALASQIAEIRNAGITEPALTLSNVTHEGVDALKRILAPGKTYCFVGSSGVGKSTLINALLGRDALQTQDVSGSGEGRHTTVRRELMLLANGALVVDNPGMREFGVLGADGGLEASYPEIFELASHCRFRDCTHTNEPGCAVLEAVEVGQISADHFESFVQLTKESAYYEASYAERRKKDRERGRFFKSAKKDLQ
ncbi:MAG: ribosome small subunit-dependent GTPase A [Gemmatimonadaceae bacterium]|jgi:ribosome biogenesis GTPase